MFVPFSALEPSQSATEATIVELVSCLLDRDAALLVCGHVNALVTGSGISEVPERQQATPLRNAVIASVKWTVKKLDGALTAVVNASAVGGVVWLYNHPEHLRMAYDAVIKWLDLAANTLL